jgi:hypothetical protein
MIARGSLRPLRKNPDRGGIAADIGQRKGNAELHRVFPNNNRDHSSRF